MVLYVITLVLPVL